MANGRVVTGFSKPYAALYHDNGDGTVSYSGAQALARGVEVSLEPESAEDNNFYADNVVAESASGIFTGGTATLTVDGLFMAARRKFFGLPEAGADGWTAEGEKTTSPYIGLGWITRYMSAGVTTYVPTILAKTKFSALGESAATQEDEIDWQTSEITATLMRDDTVAHNWRFIGADFATEAAAEQALVAKLGGLAASFTMPTVAAEASNVVMFETPVSAIQEGVSVTGGSIVGTLKYLSDPENPIVAGWGAGNFVALKLSNFDSNLTSVKVGLDPSESSGLVEILDDPDKNGVFKVTNKLNQNFVVEATDGTTVIRNVYDLAGLTTLTA